MKDFLDRHDAVVSIIFAIALTAALLYSIFQEDNVSVGTVVGGILGYMARGLVNKGANPPTQLAPPLIPFATGIVGQTASATEDDTEVKN